MAADSSSLGLPPPISLLPARWPRFTSSTQRGLSLLPMRDAKGASDSVRQNETSASPFNTADCTGRLGLPLSRARPPIAGGHRICFARKPLHSLVASPRSKRPEPHIDLGLLRCRPVRAGGRPKLASVSATDASKQKRFERSVGPTDFTQTES